MHRLDALLILLVTGCVLDREGTALEKANPAAQASVASVGGSSSVASATVGVGGAGGSMGNGGSSTGCPVGAPGPSMLLVPHQLGAYCIDTTEVTSAHYKAFLDTTPDPTAVGPPCELKNTLVPRPTGNQCSSQHYDPVGLPNRPVACVDWCDAYAYCRWAGKRLCGKVGGGPSEFNAFADANANEWYYACSLGGAQPFPYLGSYQALTCVGDDFDGIPGDGALDEAIDVTAATMCTGGLAGLFDMSGNVMEWEDSCENASGSSSCRDRGGSFWDGALALECGAVGPLHHVRDYYNKNIGFRCCADP